MTPLPPKTPKQIAAELSAIEMLSGLLAFAGHEELGQRIVEQLRELTGVRTVLLVAHVNVPAQFELVAANPPRRARLFSSAELELFCTEHNATTWPVRPDALPPDHPARGVLLREGVKSLLSFPLVAAGKMNGVLLLLDLPEVERTGEVQALLVVLTPLIALALSSTFTFRQLERQASQLQQYAGELETTVAGRTAELRSANESLTESQHAILNMMEDACADRDRAEQAVQALQAREQRVREQAALLDVTRDAIIVINPDGQVTYWNRGAEQLYGWPAAEAVGRSLADLTFGGSPVEAGADLQTLRAKGEWIGEWRQRTRSGTPIVTACRGVLMSGPAGEAHSMLLTASDVTEAKQVEEQLFRAQRLESLGSLASGVAHDLNNVFTPIMMATEMLRELKLQQHEQEMVQLLGDSARRGADIVRQLLLFGRGGDTIRGDVDVAMVMGDLSRMMRETFPKNLALAVHSPAGLWPVRGDQTQLHQVLLNLCVNARDAMPQGGRLTVSAENIHVNEGLASRQLKARPGPHVLLRVVDSGVGIAPEVIDKIFDPFFTTKPLGQGTGLGLATTLGIVRSHGGFITLRTTPGSGSDFGVYLPAVEVITKPPVEPFARQDRRGQGELVLVLDDEANIRLLLRRALRDHGYEVVTAEDGPEAIALVGARGAEFRLVITDIMMPKMDGFQTVKAIRRMQPNLPVVAVSGVGGFRAEFDQFPPPKVHLVAKPFTIDEILTVAREALDEAAAQKPAGSPGQP